MNRPHAVSPLALLVLLALTLSACGTLSIPSFSTTKPAQPAPVRSENTGQQAQELENQGDFLGAARAYQALAEQAAEPQLQDYILHAASAYVQAGDIKQARLLVDSVAVESLPAERLTRRQVLDAQVALSEGDPQHALKALDKEPQAGAPSLQAEAHLLRAESYSLLGNHIETARARITLEPLLTDPIAIQDNQRGIVQALAMMSDDALRQLAAGPPEVLSGWMELVTIARATGKDPVRYKTQVADWRHRYRQHPASEETLHYLATITAAPAPSLTPVEPAPGVTPTVPLTTTIGSPARIALLLPLSGPLAGAGSAVREGVLAAARAQAGGNLPVTVYDVGAANAQEGATKVLEMYQQALQEGAGAVLGPLDKEGVKSLYSLGALPVPTLTLNYGDESDAAPINLYQFGLAPEDEARQAAERAWLEGHSQALVLTPSGDWGDRIYNAFKNRLEQRGGIVVDQESYPPDAVDFSATVRRLLKYSDAGEKRNKKIRPQRRQDADFIFLAAQPRQARTIRPLLQFFYASELPVYATSHVYSANPSPVADQDLEGLMFADIPWVLMDNTPQQVLRDALASQSPAAFAQYKRLYALGVDAYHLLAQIDRLRGAPEERFEGETGSLTLDAANRIHRHLVWARFVNGAPQLLEGAR
ncbi:MAG: penicillin-binding protein activator [Gammaproteobacteria bacterium]|nr:penicillin-binding protein activator [Gammaproteobacteria bacterium]